MTISEQTTHEPVPFLDMDAMHAEIADDLDEAWRQVTADTAFVGGPFVGRFEQEWAAYCERNHAVGTANGTDALMLALRGLGISEGDEVIVPANTFVATAEAVLMAGASPRFVDIDADTLLMTAEGVEAALTPRTAAVIVVHLYGQLPNMDALLTVTDRAGVALIEDAAQAHGATWRGRKAGSFGAASCFSFYPGKNLGAFGDAGAVVTDDADLTERIRSLGNHGRSPESKHLHPLAGVNSRLDGLQAAVLSTKVARIDAWTKARREAAAEYHRRLAGVDGTRLTHVLPDTDGAYHLNVVRVADRDAVRTTLGEVGIQTGIHYPVPCHQQAPYERFTSSRLPVTEQAAAAIVSLPMFPHITSAQIGRVCTALGRSVDPGSSR